MFLADIQHSQPVFPARLQDPFGTRRGRGPGVLFGGMYRSYVILLYSPLDQEPTRMDRVTNIVWTNA